MYVDRDEVATLKHQLNHVRQRVNQLAIPDGEKVARVIERRYGVNDNDMREAGFNPRDPKHRDAWRRRNDGSFGGSF
jgi:hypothetical protein